MGQAASMASLLLAAGEPGQRRSLPNCRIMVHQPSGGTSVNQLSGLILLHLYTPCDFTHAPVPIVHPYPVQSQVLCQFGRSKTFGQHFDPQKGA